MFCWGTSTHAPSLPTRHPLPDPRGRPPSSFSHRVLYEIKELRNLQVFLDKVIVAVKELGNLVFIVILTTLIFALLGMQLFGGKMGSGETLSRSNFDEVFSASITTFQVLTVEDWPPVMWQAMTGAGPAYALFFVALIIIGRHMVLSLFIAVLLDSLWKARWPLFSERTPSLFLCRHLQCHIRLLTCHRSLTQGLLKRGDQKTRRKLQRMTIYRVRAGCFACATRHIRFSSPACIAAGGGSGDFLSQTTRPLEAVSFWRQTAQMYLRRHLRRTQSSKTTLTTIQTCAGPPASNPLSPASFSTSCLRQGVLWELIVPPLSSPIAIVGGGLHLLGRDPGQMVPPG